MVVGDFNIPFSTIDRSSRQKINMEMLDLNHTLDQMELTYICRTFHPTVTEHKFFSITYGIFSRINHMIDHKSSFRNYKNIEIILSIFSKSQSYESKN